MQWTSGQNFMNRKPYLKIKGKRAIAKTRAYFYHEKAWQKSGILGRRDV